MKKIFVTILILLSTFSLYAQDKRLGAFYSASLGLGYQNVAFTYNEKDLNDEDYFTSSINLKAGLCLGDGLAIFITRHTTLFSAPFIDEDGTSSDKMYMTGLSGVGASFYFEDSASFFLSGSVGIAELQTLGYANADFGTAFMLGGGYEFKNNINLEFIFSMSNIPSSDNESLIANIISTQLLLGYTFY